MRIGLDGHLRVYDIYWQEVSDLLTSDIGPCGYPTVWNEEWDIDSNHEKEIYSDDDVSTSN